jgi:ketosteroid isomerase-like protein
MTATHDTEHASTESVARGVFAALDRRDLTGVASYLREDDVQDFLPIGVRTGRSAVLAVFAELFAAIPDLRMEVEDILVQGDKACVRWRLRGTFSAGSFQGIRATGRPLDIRGADAAIEVTDGLIARNTIFYDGAGFARAIGLLPVQGSLAERLLIGTFNLRTRLVGLGRVLLRRHLG